MEPSVFICSAECGRQLLEFVDRKTTQDTRTLKPGHRHAGLSSWPSRLPLEGRGSCCPTPCSLKCWLCPEPSCACTAARPWAAAVAPMEVLQGPGVTGRLSSGHLGGRLPGRTSEQWPQESGGQLWDTALGLGGGTRQPREGPAVSRSWAWQARDQGACLHTPGHNTVAHLGSLGSLCTEARLQGGHPADPGHGRGERRQVALLLVCSLPQLHPLAASTP